LSLQATLKSLVEYLRQAHDSRNGFGGYYRYRPPISAICTASAIQACDPNRTFAASWSNDVNKDDPEQEVREELDGSPRRVRRRKSTRPCSIASQRAISATPDVLQPDTYNVVTMGDLVATSPFHR